MPAPKGHPNYDTEGLAGRPKTYDKEFVENKADELLKWAEEPNNIFPEKFIISCKINPKRMYEWIEWNERFREAYQIISKKQEFRLKEGALFKEMESGMAKFLLINNHGYAEKTETKVSGDANNPLSFIIDNIQSSKELVSGEKE